MCTQQTTDSYYYGQANAEENQITKSKNYSAQIGVGFAMCMKFPTKLYIPYWKTKQKKMFIPY